MFLVALCIHLQIPEANDPDFGAVYSKNADQRSWKILTDLLEEIFLN